MNIDFTLLILLFVSLMGQVNENEINQDEYDDVEYIE